MALYSVQNFCNISATDAPSAMVWEDSLTEHTDPTSPEDVTLASDAMDAALSRLEQALDGQAARAAEIDELKQALAQAREEIEALSRENGDLKAAFANSEKKRLGVEARNRDTSGRLDAAIDKLQTILEAA